MKIPIGETKIEAGVITFALDHRQEFNEGQGVGIQVIGDVNGTPKDLLRFDCFDFRPHYHYDPDAADPYKKVLLDKVTAGNPIGWSIKRIRDRLQPMLTKAGYGDIADRLDMDLVRAKLPELESTAREMALRDKVNVVHDRGDEVIVAGNLKFGLEYRQFAEDQGVSIHVLSDVAGQEIEILAFDCFEKTPHYHYGPRNQDFRFYWDTVVVTDPLEWSLDQFKHGKLPAMVQWAGYPGVASEMDNDLVIEKVTSEVGPKALALRAAKAEPVGAI